MILMLEQIIWPKVETDTKRKRKQIKNLTIAGQMELMSFIVNNQLTDLYTRKVWPEYSEAPWNMIPVCQSCHCLFHSIGNQGMMRKYISVRTWMELNGWEVFNGKLIHKD